MSNALWKFRARYYMPVGLVTGLTVFLAGWGWGIVAFIAAMQLLRIELFTELTERRMAIVYEILTRLEGNHGNASD